MRLLTWPNALSALRLPLAAAFVAADSPLAQGGIAAVAGASDFLDGWLARRLGQKSRAGELLDPLTDRVFVLVALLSHAWAGRLALWELLALLARDLYTLAAFVSVTLFRLPLRFRSRPSGKVVTVLQVAGVLLLLAAPGLAAPLAVAAGLTGAYAIVDYTRAGLDALRRAERGD